MAPSKKTPLRCTLYTGSFLYTPSLGQLKVLENIAIGVDENAIIAFILEDEGTASYLSAKDSRDAQSQSMFQEMVKRHGWQDGQWDCVDSRRGGTEWWFPGFVGA